jgi:hypothetical protein
VYHKYALYLLMAVRCLTTRPGCWENTRKSVSRPLRT